MSKAKVILLQGKLGFKPKLVGDQVLRFRNNANWDFQNNKIELKHPVGPFNDEKQAFKGIYDFLNNMRPVRFTFSGEILGLLFENDKYTKYKFMIIKNEKDRTDELKHEKCEFRIVKPRGGQPPPPPPQKKPPPSPPPPPSQPQQKNSKYIPKLTPLSFDTLDDNNELDDAIVQAYINIHLNQQKDNRKIAFETNYIMECLKQKRFKDILEWQDFKDNKIKDYDYIMFPIHRGGANIGGHWILCIIDMRKAQVKIYDSMQAGYQYPIDVFLIKEFLKYAGITNEFKTVYIKGPKQAGGTVDCGVFVSEYAKRFILNQRQSFTQKNIHQIRINMKNLLKPYIYISKPKPKK